MKNLTHKMLMMACFVFIAGYSNAQFKFSSKSSVGQTFTIDSVKEIGTLLVDFNTDLDSSYWTQDTEITINWAKCQTNKGFQVNVYTDASEETTVRNDDFKIYRWNNYDNPVRIASFASLEELMAKWKEKYAGTEDSTQNVIWNPSGCLFDLDPSGTDQAFGTHPGMYKRIEYGFFFDFSGLALASDIKFEINTYDEGNTGQTASYTLTVAVQNTDSIIGEIADFYVSGSGSKTVNVAEVIGKDSSAFTNNKVYILLKTEGTGTAIEKGKVDPTIVFDNLMVSYKIPSWVEPPAGINRNLVLDNSDNPVGITIGTDTLVSLPIKTKGRLGSLNIINDMMFADIQRFVFLKEGALKGNDGAGNYTVDIPYAIDTAVYEKFEKTWSNAEITVAAPESGIVDDDMMLYFKVIGPISGSTVSDRLELDCGTRIWYEFFYKGLGAIAVTGVSLDKDTIHLEADSAVVLTATIEPAEATLNEVTWSSANNDIATVTDGTVTGVATGDVYIYVTTTDGGFKDSCLVTVSVPVTGVSLDQSTLSVEEGDTAVLAATVEPANASDKELTWSSANDAVATVTDGTVSGVAAGEVYIFVTTANGGFKDSCLVTVSTEIGISNREAAGIRLYPNPVKGEMLHIQLPDNRDVQSFEVYSITGVLMLRESVNSRSLIKINTNTLLEKGVYFIRFKNSQSNYTERIIVQ